MAGGLLPGLGLEDSPPREERPAYVNCGKGLSVRRGPFKLVALEGGAEQLFDIGEDPLERYSLAAGRAEWAAARADAASFRGREVAPSTAPADEVRAADENTRARLRALGYVQ
jgi:hypothetical protein